MNTDPRYQYLLELSWRRKLTSSEEAELRAWLAANPSAQTEWDSEAALNEAFARLGEPTVATNFTVRVLQAIDLDEAAAARRQNRSKWTLPRVWLPRLAFGAVLAAAGFFSYETVRQQPIRQVGKSIEVVSDVAALPSPEVLKDFKVIRSMSKAREADTELLALLQ